LAANPKIELTEEQKMAIGNIVSDHFGAHFQTGIWRGGGGWIYVSWQTHPQISPRMAFIALDGTVVLG
jgi:hypothetical protein